MTKANNTAKPGKKSMVKKISPGSKKPETCSVGVRGLTPAPDVKPKHSLIRPFGVGSGAGSVTLCRPPAADAIQAEVPPSQSRQLSARREIVEKAAGTSPEFRITAALRISDAGNTGQQPDAVEMVKSSSQKI
jgi:hypothetical protein